MKIGFFDSGLGGLTVLKQALDSGLEGEIYYLGDTKNTPYGIKPEEDVKKIVEDNIEYLVNIGCNPIVIACNTATCLCIKELREKYKDITFIGTEPAVKVAADAHLNKRILVLATSITIRQEKLLSLVENLNITKNVDLAQADRLVQFAEDINCKNNTEEINEYIKSILMKYDLEKYSHIVLGCTHFPLLLDNFKSVLKDIAPNFKIEIVDGAKGISKNLINHIKKEEKNVKNNIDVIITSENSAFIARMKQILNTEKIEVEYKLQ